MKIKWTKEALFNIQEIEDFISQDDQTAAINLTNKFISLVEDLFNFPKKGRIVPELSFDQIRETLYKNYRIVYLIKKNSIEILTVFEGHKLLDKDYYSNKEQLTHNVIKNSSRSQPTLNNSFGGQASEKQRRYVIGNQDIFIWQKH